MKPAVEKMFGSQEGYQEFVHDVLDQMAVTGLPIFCSHNPTINVTSRDLHDVMIKFTADTGLDMSITFGINEHYELGIFSTIDEREEEEPHYLN